MGGGAAYPRKLRPPAGLGTPEAEIEAPKEFVLTCQTPKGRQIQAKTKR